MIKKEKKKNRQKNLSVNKYKNNLDVAEKSKTETI